MLGPTSGSALGEAASGEAAGEDPACPACT